MTRDPHFQALEKMYLDAPINAFYDPRIEVSDAEAIVEIEVSEKLFHSAEAVHGSVYFKMLDDAAFFAASSLEKEVFVLTTSFTTYLTTVSYTHLTLPTILLVYQNKSQLIAEAVVYDAQGNEVGRGSGIFVRGRVPLLEVPGYTP